MMKRVIYILAIGLLVTSNFEVNAQMDKKEAKAWKKKLKSLSPQQYKDLLDDNKAMKTELSTLKKETSKYESKIQDRDDQITQYQEQISNLRSELAAVKTSKPKAPKKTGPSYVADESGIVFKVQIGAYRKKDITKYAKNSPNFSASQEDGLNKYSIGAFRDYWEADDFKKHIREMGISGAFIVSYKDGKKVPIKQVLEGVVK